MSGAVGEDVEREGLVVRVDVGDHLVHRLLDEDGKDRTKVLGLEQLIRLGDLRDEGDLDLARLLVRLSSCDDLAGGVVEELADSSKVIVVDDRSITFVEESWRCAGELDEGGFERGDELGLHRSSAEDVIGRDASLV